MSFLLASIQKYTRMYKANVFLAKNTTRNVIKGQKETLGRLYGDHKGKRKTPVNAKCSGGPGGLGSFVQETFPPLLYCCSAVGHRVKIS